MESPEVDIAVRTLAETLEPETLLSLIRRALGADVACITATLSTDALSPAQSARCLVALRGSNVLADRDIREAIVSNAHEDDIEAAFDHVHSARATLKARDSVSRTTKVRDVATHAWHPGSTWSRQFCDAFHLAPELAGISNESATAKVERVSPFVPLNELHQFQREISDRILALLSERPDGRALIALPTGAGKTRLMVDTVLGLEPILNGTKKIVWVAQHDELCEQAVQCFAQVWRSRERPRDRHLAIQRVWKGLNEEIDWNADVFVGTPESLQPRLKRSETVDRQTVLVTIIDEAHAVVGDGYASLFGLLATSAIFGITATPGSSMKERTRKLRAGFMDNLIIAKSLGNEPVAKLTELGFLAKADPEVVKTSVSIGSSDFGVGAIGSKDLSPAALTRLGSNVERNRTIIDRLLRVDLRSQVLCFAPSVKASRAIAAALSLKGRNARSIDAESDMTYRAETVRDFNDSRLQFLINYGVLATGFDAPKIDCLVLARPTTSAVLYEQMLGRGLRGPRNGGTPNCTVIHFEDDFTSFGGIEPMSYARFLEWAER